MRSFYNRNIRSFLNIALLMLFALTFLNGQAYADSDKEARLIRNTDDIYKYFYEIKNMVDINGDIPFPTWQTEVLVYISDTLTPSLRSIAMSTVSELSSLSGVNFIITNSLESANLIIISSNKEDVDIREGGKWTALLNQNIKGRTVEPLNKGKSDFNCITRSDVHNGEVKFSLTAIIYTNQSKLILEDYGPKCMRIAMFAAMGVITMSTAEDSIFNRSIPSNCYTHTDEVILKVGYSKIVRRYFKGNINEANFKNFLIKTYNEMIEHDTGKCDQ